MITTVARDAVKPEGAPAASSDEAQSAKLLNDLLEAGKFALYHLHKAKLALAANDLSNAQYQVTASLSHDRLEEAVALKAEIKARAKAR